MTQQQLPMGNVADDLDWRGALGVACVQGTDAGDVLGLFTLHHHDARKDWL